MPKILVFIQKIAFALGTSGRVVLKKSISYVFANELPYVDLPLLGVAKCIAAVGDYIAIARDFAAGVKNLTWVPIHDHLMMSRPQGGECIRKGRSVGWAADFIFLDLPFGGVQQTPPTCPSWDVCTEEHVRCGVALSASTLSDSGWLLIMASFGGKYKPKYQLFCMFVLIILNI